MQNHLVLLFLLPARNLFHFSLPFLSSPGCCLISIHDTSEVPVLSENVVLYSLVKLSMSSWLKPSQFPTIRPHPFYCQLHILLTLLNTLLLHNPKYALYYICTILPVLSFTSLFTLTVTGPKISLTTYGPSYRGSKPLCNLGILTVAFSLRVNGSNSLFLSINFFLFLLSSPFLTCVQSLIISSLSWS